MRPEPNLPHLLFSLFSYRYKRSHCYYGNDYLYRNDIRLTSSQQRIIDNYQLQIDEKNFEINKILNSDNINWNQVEKLNKEIAEIRAKIETELMKLTY